MDGGAVSATVEILVQNLIKVSEEEISLIHGLEKNADKLKKTLSLIQSFLDDAQKKFISEDAVKKWLKQLEDVAFDADNVLDELNYQLLSNKRKNIDAKTKKKVTSCFPSLSHGLHRRQMALKINDINTSFESIRKNATELGLETSLANAPAYAPDAAASETNSFAIDPIFIGRDDDVSKIVEMMTTPTEEAVSILPIVGMGGLGKTTLARNVFNHQKTKAHFGHHIWVYVSQDFDALSLFKKILSNLKGENTSTGVESSEEVVLKKLREALGGKTYLLVLDDVWNENRQKWDGFIRSLSGISSTNGNGILVTTRNIEVGSIVKTRGVHQLNGLADEECWSIIKDRAFRGGDIPQGIEGIGRSIAERCRGLPLAANVVGGVLRDKSQDDWLSIKQDWLSDVGADDKKNILKILKLSFDCLPSPSLKKCFAYCSVIPKRFGIERAELIQLWMAEGFLQTGNMENVGDINFNLLLQNSLLQVVHRNKYDNKILFGMHDLVHDLAESVLGSPKVKDNIPDGCRYIYWEYNGAESSHIPKEKAEQLRTLFYEGEVSETTFSDFRSLRALTLMSEDAQELPGSIRNLIHLRYLDISDTSIRNVPDWIGELYHLQTFISRGRDTRLEKLPSTLKYLFNLRHLHMYDYTELPPHMGTLTSLRTLLHFKVRDEEGHRIVELGTLKNLKGELEIRNLEKVQGEEESKKAYLFKKSGIVRLGLWWNVFREGVQTNDEHVLKGIQPPQNLKMLKISGFQGKSFPSWTLRMAVCLEGHWVGLDSLMEITLESCSECEEIPTVGHLPRLKSLCLSGLRNVKCIGSSFYGIDSGSVVFEETITVFPALERLDLLDMPNLTEWVQVENPDAAQVKAFPRLEYLNISRCQQLRSFPSQFPYLRELVIQEMNSEVPLEYILGIQLTSLAKLIIRGLHETVCLPDWLFLNNRNLSRLEISDCPKLREVPDGLHTLHSLEELTISRCPNLKSVPYSSGQQPFLWSLSLSEVPQINLPRGMVESWAPSLEVLQLYGRVMNMAMIIDCLSKMSRLQNLEIIHVPKFIMTSPGKVGSLRSLHFLTISCDGSDSWDTASFNRAIDGILRLGSHSLRHLGLTGMEDWESLPDELQHLSALKELHLHDFGMQELPEWFGDLSSLHYLTFSNCKRLRCLPFVEAMQRLHNLTHLTIDDCPLLKERFTEQRSNDDSEWLKIAHLAITIQWTDNCRIWT